MIALIGGLEDGFEITAVFTGFGTKEFSVSYWNRQTAEFITSTGSGFVNDTVLTFLFHFPCIRIIFPAIR
jgi:hypothetical protein